MIAPPNDTATAFDRYTASLDFLVLVGEPREKRIAAAWEAGGGTGPLPSPLCPSPYLYDRMREAFRLGSGR